MGVRAEIQGDKSSKIVNQDIADLYSPTQFSVVKKVL